MVKFCYTLLSLPEIFKRTFFKIRTGKYVETGKKKRQRREHFLLLF